MIQWNLTEQQADQVLNALGQQPFIQVQGLIGELIKQANHKTPVEVAMPSQERPVPVPLANGAIEGPGQAATLANQA